MCWTQKLFFIMVLFLALASLLGGCGNKGKLYLPDNNKPAVSPLTHTTKDNGSL